MTETLLLKKDLFGEIRLSGTGRRAEIVRDVAPASPAIRWLARALLRREARALAALDGVPGVPGIGRIERDRMTRSYLPGTPLHRARPADAHYFADAARLLRRMHRRDVVHNDLAKEPNLLVLDDGGPAFVDFQLAWHARRRGRLFRALAFEDIRHLLKHKRTYRPDLLTARERRILENPGCLARTWRRTVKPAYLFVTRGLLGWADREGAADRGSRS
ncbi:MAG: hypothetical protein R3176_05125 [Woeseiaceae bacterium]|nr:hypothetical protein [Woeseiaceae bacterium]